MDERKVWKMFEALADRHDACLCGMVDDARDWLASQGYEAECRRASDPVIALQIHYNYAGGLRAFFAAHA